MFRKGETNLKQILKLNNINKEFKQNMILENITFEISKGELIHISGGNGSGKSTLFKIIAGIIEADSGTIELNLNSSMGALIENPNFIEDASMYKNLKFLADINKNFNPTVIENLCGNFGLDFSSKMKMKNYSVGMRQKVGIIQAIMENQQLILLDEPTRGLDESSLTFFKQLIEKLVTENKTIIIASHDNSSNLLFDKMYKLDSGRLLLKQ